MSDDLRPVIHVQEDSVFFRCPGCDCVHRMWIRGDHPHVWTWNGDRVKPTLSPSLLINGPGRYHTESTFVCHLFVREGVLQYLNDSTHKFSGRNVPMEQW